MSDDLEQRLQQAFQRGSLPPAPASLVEALQRVPDAPVRSRRSMSRRSTFGLLAAALLVATVGALAISGGSPRPGPTTPTVAPTASPAPETGLRLEYEVLPSDGVKPGPADLATIVSIIERRVAATGVVGATVQADGPDRIIVKLPGVTDATPIRKLIGQTGRIDFVPLGQTQVTIHQTIDSGRYPPLFSADQVGSATVSADQNGQPAIDFVLKPEGARLFARLHGQEHRGLLRDHCGRSGRLGPGDPERDQERGGPDHTGARGIRCRGRRDDRRVPQLRRAAIPDPGGWFATGRS